MRDLLKRPVMALVGLLVAALLLTTAGVAIAWGSNGMLDGTLPGMHGGSGPTGPMGPMGGSGGMMGQGSPGMMGGSGGMMGGSGHGGQGSQGQAPAATPSAGVSQVAIQNFAYLPANITVRVGTTVTWTNQDSTPHTVTFKNGMKDSSMLRQGQSFSYTFTGAGTYAYYCAYHPYMTGVVTVTT